MNALSRGSIGTDIGVFAGSQKSFCMSITTQRGVLGVDNFS